jgi:hypothetical protein
MHSAISSATRRRTRESDSGPLGSQPLSELSFSAKPIFCERCFFSKAFRLSTTDRAVPLACDSMVMAFNALTWDNA